MSFNQNGQFPGRELNLGSPKYKYQAELPLTRLPTEQLLGQLLSTQNITLISNSHFVLISPTAIRLRTGLSRKRDSILGMGKEVSLALSVQTCSAAFYKMCNGAVSQSNIL
jgi:hypothetical protein